MIDRFGRRSLMMAGSLLQFFAYVMVAVAVALLAKAPTQVSADALHASGRDELTFVQVGWCGDYFPFLLLCCIWMHLGYGTVGLPVGGQQPCHESERRSSRYVYKLVVWFRLHTVHTTGY